ncbi:hypothetical protein [Desulfobacula sp.]|uniref:hypothetical protein n=1 Tax=Desulfobacula sp. TaxID=2593537 RepID=UPI002637BE1D|nr:hypothetical protein [Desulfobacula sp.]
MRLILHPERTTLVFVIFVILLTTANAVLMVVYYHSEYTAVIDILPLFNVDMEKNIPTLYSSVALFFCSFLLLICGSIDWKNQNPRWIYWIGLTLIFFFLSLDEGLTIHEHINNYTDRYVNATGLIYFPWVLPYGIGVSLIALVYVSFLLRLPRQTAVLFVVSGGVFLMGAVGFEMLSARAAERYSYESIRYAVFYSVEEFLEMTGIVIFIYTLLKYLQGKNGSFSVTNTIKIHFDHH